MSRVSTDRAAQLAVLKATRRARYECRVARNKPIAPSHRYPAELRLTPRQKAYCTIRGVPQYLQQVVRMMFGSPGTWGHGQYVNGTKKGPGRRRIPVAEQNHPAGTKLVRGFIRQSGRESSHWRSAYAALTGKQYGVVTMDE